MRSIYCDYQFSSLFAISSEHKKLLSFGYFFFVVVMTDLFFINQEFSNYNDFLNLIKQYKASTQHSLSVKDRRTMQKHCEKKKLINDYPNLPYYYINFHCPRAGIYVPKKKMGPSNAIFS